MCFESGWKSICKPACVLTEPRVGNHSSSGESVPVMQLPGAPAPLRPLSPLSVTPHSLCHPSSQWLPWRHVPLPALSHPFCCVTCTSSHLHSGFPISVALQGLYRDTGWTEGQELYLVWAGKPWPQGSEVAAGGGDGPVAAG